MPDESRAIDATPASGKVDAVDLEQMNVSELRRLIAKAQALEGKKIEEEKSKLLSILERDARKLGYVVNVEWRPRPLPKHLAKVLKKTRGKVTTKYRGPNGEEWGGRGRPPKWLMTHEAEGRKRDEFRIE